MLRAFGLRRFGGVKLGWLGLLVWAPLTWASLWTELAENFSLERAPPDVRMITEQARWLRGNEVDTLAQARPWLAYIYAQTRAKDVPAELALLPFVESAFDPKAISKADARGMWQFIDSTGKAYGLATESGCEPRYDVIRSTDAALSHLKDLRAQTGDWLLALAAYNAGLNAVKTAQRYNLNRGLPTDFWHLSTLPKETQTYVPRLLALRDLLVEQLMIGEPVPVLPNQTLMFAVEIPPMTWAELGYRLNVSTELLYRLNPCWKQGPTISTQVLVPRNPESASLLQAWLW